MIKQLAGWAAPSRHAIPQRASFSTLCTCTTKKKDGHMSTPAAHDGVLHPFSKVGASTPTTDAVPFQGDDLCPLGAHLRTTRNPLPGQTPLPHDIGACYTNLTLAGLTKRALLHRCMVSQTGTYHIGRSHKEGPYDIGRSHTDRHSCNPWLFDLATSRSGSPMSASLPRWTLCLYSIYMPTSSSGRPPLPLLVSPNFASEAISFA